MRNVGNYFISCYVLYFILISRFLSRHIGNSSRDLRDRSLFMRGGGLAGSGGGP